ncbi:Nn.00g006230.m01.CDS01 [Neocucurbitaria sp. VM-36]
MTDTSNHTGPEVQTTLEGKNVLSGSSIPAKPVKKGDEASEERQSGYETEDSEITIVGAVDDARPAVAPGSVKKKIQIEFFDLTDRTPAMKFSDQDKKKVIALVSKMWPLETGFRPVVDLVEHPKTAGKYLAQIYHESSKSNVCLWKFKAAPYKSRSEAFRSLISQLEDEDARGFVARAEELGLPDIHPLEAVIKDKGEQLPEAKRKRLKLRINVKKIGTDSSAWYQARLIVVGNGQKFM